MNKKQLILILNFLISYLDAENSKNYGLLTIDIKSIDLCRGPRRRDCCVPVISVSKGIFLKYDLLVKENLVLNAGKVVATTQGKEVLKFQMKKACDHFLVKSMFKIYMNITDNCGIAKGHYVFTINIQDLSDKYYGGKYFYGNWTFRSVFAGNDCNLFCTMMNIEMMPKKV